MTTRTEQLLEVIQLELRNQTSTLTAMVTGQEEARKDAARAAKLGSGSKDVSIKGSGTSRIGGALAGAGGAMSGLGGLLGGLGKGIGFAGAGIGAGLLGLSTVMDQIPDAGEIKDSVETLLSIGDGYEDRGEFLKDGGTLFLMLSGIGAGLAIFSIGQGATALADWATEDNWPQTIKDNVETLLSITSVKGADGANVATLSATLGAMGLALAAFGIGQGVTGVAGAITEFSEQDNWASTIKDNVKTLLEIPDLPNATLGNIASFPLTMGSLGLGLTAFAIGQAISGLGAVPTNMSDALKQFTGGEDWATKIKNNVETLLGIPDLKNATLGNLLSFPLIMGSLAVGLSVFAVGQAVSGIATIPNNVQDSLKQFTGGEDWATKIKSNVQTLLEIPDLKNATLGNLVSFPLIMGSLAVGLAAFALGKGVEGLTEVGQEGLTYFTSQEGFATRIKSEVKTLLEIPGLPGVAGDTAGFIAVMGGIATGLAAFALGKGVEGVTTGFQGALSSFTGTEPFAERIKTEVSTLLSIPSLMSEGDTERFATVMGSIGGTLATFGAGEFIGTLANAGASIVGFFTGAESPFEQIRQIARDADQLEKGANAVDKLQTALDRMGGLQFDGSDLNLKDFAEDLLESIPVIEAAIMGGTVEKFGLFNDVDFKGLASPDIDYESAVRNITSLRASLGFEVGDATSVSAAGGTSVGGTAVSAPVSNSYNTTNTNNYYQSTGSSHSLDPADPRAR